MADNFLSRCHSYSASVEATVLRRRSAVCKVLKADYQNPKGMEEEAYEEAEEQLSDEGIFLSKILFEADRKVLRFAYVWLTCSEKERPDMLRQAQSEKAHEGIEALIADGIKSFDDIPAAPRKQTLVKAAESAGEPDDRDEYIAYLVEVVSELEEKNRSLTQRVTEAEKSTLEQIAERHPEMRELTLIAQKMGKTQSDRQKRFADLREKLPKKFIWENDSGEIAYRDIFIRELDRIPPQEQKQVIKQMETLASRGQFAPSLNTSTPRVGLKIPQSPPGCHTSRASDRLRFSWKKNGEVVVYYLYSMGGSGLPFKES